MRHYLLDEITLEFEPSTLYRLTLREKFKVMFTRK